MLVQRTYYNEDADKDYVQFTTSRLDRVTPCIVHAMVYEVYDCDSQECIVKTESIGLACSMVRLGAMSKQNIGILPMYQCECALKDFEDALRSAD